MSYVPLTDDELEDADVLAVAFGYYDLRTSDYLRRLVAEVRERRAGRSPFPECPIYHGDGEVDYNTDTGLGFKCQRCGREITAEGKLVMLPRRQP